MRNRHFSSAEAKAGRVIVGRLLPGADLIRGLEEVCREHGVRYAAVNFAYGSLERAAFKHLRRPLGESRAVLVPLRLDKRVEFLGGQGLVCDDAEGARDTHLHGCVSDETGLVLGGHFIPGENPIYNNLDFTLHELHGVRLIRRMEPETQTIEMDIEPLPAGPS